MPCWRIVFSTFRGCMSYAPDGGLVVPLSTSAIGHRELIFAMAARHRLPAIYPNRLDVAGGGLISYGPNGLDQYRRVAGYVDRILKGEKPADLPVQAPTKYELVINLKTAKTLGDRNSRNPARPRRRGDRISTRHRTYLFFGDIEGKLHVLRVERTKCRRKGRDQVHKLIAKYGRRGNLMKWKEQLNGDCPRRDALSLHERSSTSRRRQGSGRNKMPIRNARARRRLCH